jgi:predicted  nucleic acid-binding Zn-ribbon protein
MFGILTGALAVAIIAVKWLTITNLKSMRADLLEAQTSAMDARNRLKVALNEKAGTERRIGTAGRSIQTAERHVAQLEKELAELQARAEEQAMIARQKLALTEDLRRKSGPLNS